MYEIGWKPRSFSASFHGRDLFAPVVAMLAAGKRKAAKLLKRARLSVDLGKDDADEVIYVDHYGNLVTGLRANAVSRNRKLLMKGSRIAHARVFSAVAPGRLFWYENSLGLVEVAANGASAARMLGAAPGTRVS